MLAVADDAAVRPKCELAHVFREYGEVHRRTHRLPPSHRRVMQAIENCRTSALGGHMEQCNVCVVRLDDFWAYFQNYEKRPLRETNL